MTFEERLATLGVDLSDLPTRYEAEHRSAAFDAADNFGGSLGMTQNFEDYILHLTDIIDRMETRIINLTGERDYLVEKLGDAPSDCSACTYDADTYCNNEQAECSFDFAGVPEDWRADDGCSD